jgi:glutamate dehydrogenase/leucine dehydrogenase
MRRYFMESLIKNWDGETVVIRHDKESDAWIFIAVHSTRLGLGAGGTRMKNYPELNLALQDALRLSEAMTYKYAVANFPQGGAKAVIALPVGFDPADRPDLLRRYGKLVKSLGGLYSAGPDVGTSPADMDIIAETGAPFIHACTPAAGGKGDSGGPTARGVFCGIQATLEYMFGNPSVMGKRILVQGTGGVGSSLIERLLTAGAEVLFSEVSESAIHHYRDEKGLQYISPEIVFDTTCDIFSPCAMGGILNKESIPRLQCRAVVGGANLQLAEPEDMNRLQKRGILYAPDFVVNIGGAMAITGMEAMGWTRKEAEEHVCRVRVTLLRVYELAEKNGISTDAAARQIALENLNHATK